jgi:hypothetical protein
MNFNTGYQNPYNPVEWYQKQKPSYLDLGQNQTYLSNPLNKSYLTTNDATYSHVINPPEKPVFAPLDKQDPLYSFFESKRRILGKSVEDVAGLISERQDIKYDNLHKIEYDICKVITKLYELDHWPPETNFSVERKRGQFETELLNFEREKRMEEVSCWRDVTRLRGDLRELMMEVYGEQRRQQLIRGD